MKIKTTDERLVDCRDLLIDLQVLMELNEKRRDLLNLLKEVSEQPELDYIATRAGKAVRYPNELHKAAIWVPVIEALYPQIKSIDSQIKERLGQMYSQATQP